MKELELSNDFQSIAGTKTEWFDGMVEATLEINKDETAYIICHESMIQEVKKMLHIKSAEVLK